jgi:uncharacterized membrane protein
VAGVLAYNWGGMNDWVYPLGPVGDKKKITSAIEQMNMGDMPSLHAHLQAAYDALVQCDAGQKHVIVISDGDPTAPTPQLLGQLAAAKITCTGVCIFPHDPRNKWSLQQMATDTGGRYHDVMDPAALPQIFIKEAQVVRRALTLEETFTPQIAFGLSEVLRGVAPPLPALDGYVLTGPKGGLNQLVLTTHQADPLLATCQAGLGRCVAFTSSADSRWAGAWLQWPDFVRFWEQVVRWAGRPAQSTDCEIFTDVEGREVTVSVEATATEQGGFTSFAGIEGQVLTPEMKSETLPLTQTGPGQYAGRFQVSASGSYVVNLQYRMAGPEQGTRLANAIVTVPFAPEFRDLSDNAPLLAEVSRMTSGRVLSLASDPNAVNLYDYAGLRFPETHLPLLRPLLLAWIVLFLLDVAVRRVVLDIRAALRRVKDWLARAARREEDQVIARLQARRQKLREQWSARTADARAAQRYEGAQKYEGELLSAEPKREVPAPAAPKSAEPKPPAPGTHIDQLLQAKRRKTGPGDDRGDRG